MKMFSVSVGKELLHFTAAHFIAFKGFREPLHGHTYHVGVTVGGPVSADGYVVDFLHLKKIAAEEISRLHFTTLIPGQSDCLDVRVDEDVVRIVCEDGSTFSLPRRDVCLLPIVHTSSEEIAAHLVDRFRKCLATPPMNNIDRIEIQVEDIPGQVAVCRWRGSVSGDDET